MSISPEDACPAGPAPWRGHPEVLLVVTEWRERTLIRAQLLEEGVRVRALGRWEEAAFRLLRPSAAPDLLVISVELEGDPEERLREVASRFPAEATLVLTAPSRLPRAGVIEAGFPYVLSRPFQVRDVVGWVRGRLPSHDGVSRL